MSVSSITYHFQHIITAEAHIKLVYSSDGTLLSKIYGHDRTEWKNPVFHGLGTYTVFEQDSRRDYCGDFVYADSELERIFHEAGWLDSEGRHTARICDFQGNVRATWTQDDYVQPVFQVGGGQTSSDIQLYRNLTAYYPYGLPLAEWQGEDRYLYSGKELERTDGLMLYDHHARLYDPQLGCFISPDPLAADYAPTAPHLYCAANPIVFTDPTGMIYKFCGTKTLMENFISQTNAGCGVKLSLDGQQLSYSVPDGYTPTEIEGYLIEGIEDERITVNMYLTDQDVVNGTHIICGHFGGSTVNPDGTVTATQYANPRQMKVYSDFYKTDSGVTEIHEMVEAYLGAKLFPGTPPAKSDVKDNNNENYEKVHDMIVSSDPRFVPPIVYKASDKNDGNRMFYYFKYSDDQWKKIKTTNKINYDRKAIEETDGRYTK